MSHSLEIYLKQSFSTVTLLTFLAAKFFVGRGRGSQSCAFQDIFAAF